MSVELVESVGVTILGEGPHWDDKRQTLFYVDMIGKTLHRLHPESGLYEKVDVDEMPSVIIPIADSTDDEFLVTQEREIWIYRWPSGENATRVRKIGEVDTQDESLGNRINDSKCDASGRLWCGTLGPGLKAGHIQPRKGAFYCLLSENNVKFHFGDVWCSNGMAWTDDNKTFYYTDSFNYTIDAFDFDLESATISNRRPVFDFKEMNIKGIPDGLCIDIEGNLWVALFGGKCVANINPREKNALLRTIELPASQITSCNWGGADFDELWVTSSNMEVNGITLDGENHGGLFKITGLDAKGLPCVAAKIA